MAGACVVSLQLLLTGVFFRVMMSESDWLYSTSISLAAAFLAALLAWPMSRGCEKLFWCSRVQQQSRLRIAKRSNPHARSQNEITHRGAALSCTLDLIDLKCLWQGWRQAVVSIRVSARSVTVNTASKALRFTTHSAPFSSLGLITPHAMPAQVRHLRENLRQSRRLKMAIDVPTETSRVHASYANVLSAGYALTEWRNATIHLLQGAHSWALQRAHSQIRRDLLVRLIRFETLAAPETIRQLDEDMLKRCSEAYNRLSRLRSVSRISFASALMGDHRMRDLVGFISTISREDGSRDFLEAISKVMKQHDEGRALEYEEFKRVFIGISRAVAAVSSPDGASLVSSVSANVVKQLWATRVESTHRNAFGIVPVSSRAGAIAPGCGFEAKSCANLDLRQPATLFDNGMPHVHANLTQTVGETQHDEAWQMTEASASFLRIPGPRRLQHRLQHLAANPRPASLPIDGQGALDVGKALRQPRMVSLHSKPLNTQRDGHRQLKTSRRVQIAAIAGQPLSSKDATLQRARTVVVVPKSPSNSEQPAKDHGVVEAAVVPVKVTERAVATLNFTRECWQDRDAAVCANQVALPSGDFQSTNSEPALNTVRARHSVPGWDDVVETPTIASMMRKGSGQSHPASSSGSDGQGLGAACGAFFTTPQWLLLPWVLLGCFIIATAVLAIVVIDNMKSSYEFLLWPWYNSFVQSLIYALSVQDLLLIILSSFRSRKGPATKGPAPTQRNDATLPAPAQLRDRKQEDMHARIGCYV